MGTRQGTGCLHLVRRNGGGESVGGKVVLESETVRCARAEEVQEVSRRMGGRNASCSNARNGTGWMHRYVASHRALLQEHLSCSEEIVPLHFYRGAFTLFTEPLNQPELPTWCWGARTERLTRELLEIAVLQCSNRASAVRLAQ